MDNKKLILDSIEFYEQNIKDYQEMYDRNKKIIDNPETSKKKKKAYQLLNKVIKKEIEDSQSHIKELLD